MKNSFYYTCNTLYTRHHVKLNMPSFAFIKFIKILKLHYLIYNYKNEY